MCPKGLNQKEHLSIYLDSPEAAFAPPNLNPTANFKLSIVNQKNPGAGDFFKGEQGMQATAAATQAADGVVASIRSQPQVHGQSCQTLQDLRTHYMNTSV